MEEKIEMEKRIQVLEEKFEHQDNTLEILNQVIIRLQEELDQLTEKYSDLKTAMEVMGPNSQSIEPPPHY